MRVQKSNKQIDNKQVIDLRLEAFTESIYISFCQMSLIYRHYFL